MEMLSRFVRVIDFLSFNFKTKYTWTKIGKKKYRVKWSIRIRMGQKYFFFITYLFFLKLGATYYFYHT